MSIFCKEIELYIKQLERKLKIEEKSLNTIETYMRTYKSFISFCEDYEKEITFENIKEDDIYAFLEYKSETLNKQGTISNATSNAYVIHLKKLFGFIERNNDKLYNFDKVFQDIKLKKPQSKPQGLSEEEQNKLLSTIENEKMDKKCFTTFRDALIVKTMLFAGLRVSEMLSLRYVDYKLEEERDKVYTITVKGKGNKVRTIYISRININDDLEELLKIKSIDDFVCLSSNNNIINRANVDKIIKGFCRRAKIKEYSSHKLRHTFAKNFLRNKGNIVHLKELLGHSDIKTTMIYANPHQKDIKNGFV